MLRGETMGVEAMWCGVEGEGPASESFDVRCKAVHRTLKRIVKARGALDAQEAEALREAERLRLWRRYGYSSLLEYMEMELGHSPRAALERLRVARAIVELPVIAEAMTQGDLSFSAARELTRVATPETEGLWLEAANDKNLRQVEEMVSGHQRGDKPGDPVEPKLRKRVLRYEVDAETDALVRQAQKMLERECGERLDDRALMRAFARMVIDGAVRSTRQRPPYQIAVTTCHSCKRAWQGGGGAVVEMSPSAVETAQCDAEHIGAVDGSVAHRAGTRARSDVPPALRRKVLARDHGTCRVPWCRSSRNIDLHHLKPVSEGGRHTLENLVVLCESHHIAHHEGALLITGTADDASFTRREQSTFTSVQHAVDTARALRDLGFDKHEVSTAMEKTRTHVGAADLPLQQWIKIALGYCPRPIT